MILVTQEQALPEHAGIVPVSQELLATAQSPSAFLAHVQLDAARAFWGKIKVVKNKAATIKANIFLIVIILMQISPKEKE